MASACWITNSAPPTIPPHHRTTLSHFDYPNPDAQNPVHQPHFSLPKPPNLKPRAWQRQRAPPTVRLAASPAPKIVTPAVRAAAACAGPADPRLQEVLRPKQTPQRTDAMIGGTQRPTCLASVDMLSVCVARQFMRGTAHRHASGAITPARDAKARQAAAQVSAYRSHSRTLLLISPIYCCTSTNGATSDMPPCRRAPDALW